MKVNGKWQNATYALSKPPEQMVTKIGVSDNVWNPYPVQNFITI